jgi:Ca2+-binding RTX toxin-like protein
VGGDTSSVIFVNDDTSSVPSSIFLGGGNNYVGEGSSVASAVINVDGSSVSALGSATTGLGGAYIDGSQGYTTVNLYNNAFVYLNTGSVAAGIGHDVVVAQSGTAEILGIGGSSTVPVTVTATAGSTLYVDNDATAFIAPGAGNVILSAGTTNLGQATLFGGSGSDTVFGGGNGGNQEDGYFQGGTGGNNIIVSSTVSGATTIVGAGNNNLLGTFANKDLVIAGSGNNNTLAAWGNGTGDTLIGGAGTDTIFGSTAGDTYIGFGSGSAVASGFDGGNTYFQAAAGGVDTITDFLPGSDVFSLTLSAKYENVASITVTNITTLGASGTQVTLSDNSTIDFLNVKVTNSNFS